MNQQETLEAVCEMASVFHGQGNASMSELFNGSGYRENENSITEEIIERYILERPHLLESWLLESQNTRGTPSWYISQRGSSWVVGLYPDGMVINFSNKTKAFACYIKKYMVALSEL